MTLAETKPAEVRGEAAPSPLSRITSLFKRPAHDDFPSSELYTGALSALGIRGELPVEALDSRVAAYHPGYSDEAGTTAVAVVDDTRSEHEKKPDTLARLTALFTAKSDTGPEGYPMQRLAYDGPLQPLEKQPDAEGLALPTLVSAYHSGRSDDVHHKLATTPAPEEAEVEPSTAPKASALQKITGMFARQPHHEDFPHSEPFAGSLDGLVPGTELAGERIDSHVAVYHTTGRSDTEPVAVSPETGEKKHDGVSRIASLFGPKKVSLFHNKSLMVNHNCSLKMFIQISRCPSMTATTRRSGCLTRDR
jgi:hypothetical protein